MILRRLRVENFGCLATGEWGFAAGINVVRGPNEAGKSTLAEAIAKVLLGSAPVHTTSSRYTRWRTWGREEMFVLEAEIEHAGGRFLIVRDYAEGQARLHNLDTGEVIRSEARVRRRLAEMVGMDARNSEDQYLATGYMRQGEWAAMGKAEGLDELIARAALAGGTQGDPLAVLRRLEDEHTRYARGLHRPAPVNPGPVAQALARLEDAQERLEGAEGLQARVRAEEQAREELAEARRRLDEAAAELAELEPRLEAARKRRQTERDLAQVEERIDRAAARIGEVRRLQGELADAETRLAAMQPLRRDEVAALEAKSQQAAEHERAAGQAKQQAEEAEAVAEQLAARLDAAMEDVPSEEEVSRAAELERRIQAAEEQLAASARLLESARALARSSRRWMWVCGGLAVIAGLLAVAPVGLSGTARAVAGGAALGLAAAAVWFWSRSRIGPPPEADAVGTEELDELRRSLAELLDRWQCDSVSAMAAARSRAVEQVSELQRQLGASRQRAESLRQQASEAAEKAVALQGEVSDKLAEWGVPDLASARDRAAEYEALDRSVAGLRARLAQALGSDDIESLEGELAGLEARKRALAQELDTPEMRAAAMTDAEFGELETRVRHLRDEEIPRWKQQEAQAIGALGEGTAAEKLLAAEEELKAAKREYAAAERYERVLATAVELLREAIDQVRGSARDAVLPVAGDILRRLTLGRYGRIWLDDERQPMVETDRVDRPLPVDEDDVLSFATREQVYLALRLAGYLTLWPDEGPPLILDEPLLAFDAERTRAALDVLLEIAADRQVIILTAGHEYDMVAEHIIDLGSPR